MKISTKNLVILSVFSSIILLLAFTPIGFIQMGVIKITIIHIPVIIGSILLGSKNGAFLGFLFGVASLITNTTSPALLSFAFSPLIPVPGLDRGSLMALLICFIPRILVGIIPYYLVKLLKGFLKKKNQLIVFGVIGVCGSLINTIFVMSGIYLVFKDAFSIAKNISSEAVIGTILSVVIINGIPEAIVAGLATSGICRVLYNKTNSI